MAPSQRPRPLPQPQRPAYSALVAAAVVFSVFAIALAGYCLSSYQAALSPDTTPLRNATAASVALGAFSLLWALVVLMLRGRLGPRLGPGLVALTGLVALGAAIAAAWFPPPLGTQQWLVSYQAYATTLFLGLAVFYFVLALV